MLSVYQPEGAPPPPEILEPIMRELGVLSSELKAAGAWVLTGRPRGLHPGWCLQ
jgi:hypothetical protein